MPRIFLLQQELLQTQEELLFNSSSFTAKAADSYQHTNSSLFFEEQSLETCSFWQQKSFISTLEIQTNPFISSDDEIIEADKNEIDANIHEYDSDDITINDDNDSLSDDPCVIISDETVVDDGLHRDKTVGDILEQFEGDENDIDIHQQGNDKYSNKIVTVNIL